MTNLNPQSSLPADIRNELEETFGMVPSFALTLQPDQLRLWWSALRDFQLSDKTALSPKVKELIGLGVSAQIPCHYCIVFHTEAARLNGATEQELQETIYMASLTRQGSTVLNGSLLPQEKFNEDMREIVSYLKKQAGKKESVPAGARR